MTTTVESSIDVGKIRNKIGVNTVTIRGNKLVIDIDPFFSRSILKELEKKAGNARLHDIDFEDSELVLEVSD